MRHIHIVGIGAGHPDHLTLQAVAAIARSDVFFLFDKGQDKAQLSSLRHDMIRRHRGDSPYRLVQGESPAWSSRGPGYEGIVADLNRRKTILTGQLIDTELAPGEHAAILVWGDPALYDSTIRIIDALGAERPDLTYDVIPGISSVQALAARHRIPLNLVGDPVTITPARRLDAMDWESAGTVVAMLDGGDALARLVGRDLEIFYGAYLGMAQEKLLAGPLDGLAQAIAAYRAEARRQHGWIMDSYLLRRCRPAAG